MDELFDCDVDEGEESLQRSHGGAGRNGAKILPSSVQRATPYGRKVHNTIKFADANSSTAQETVASEDTDGADGTSAANDEEALLVRFSASISNICGILSDMSG